MQLVLKNINSIQHAEIAFSGLTVIAGENDTGKSTVGKLMFAIIKAFHNRGGEELSDDKKISFVEFMGDIYRDIKKSYSFAGNRNLKNAFYPPIFLQEVLKEITVGNIRSSQAHYFQYKIQSVFSSKMDILKAAHPISENKEELENIFRDIENLKKSLISTIEKGSDDSTMISVLTKALLSEFHFEITPKHSGNESTIDLLEDENAICSIKINNNKIIDFYRDKEIPFADATLIETPIALQMYGVINSAGTLFDINTHELEKQRFYDLSKPLVPLHLKDLISKLQNIQYISDSVFDESEPLFGFVQDTLKTMHGGFSFDVQNEDFIFKMITKQKQEVMIKPINIASGIKAFGIVQLLAQTGILDNKSLLIIDEPETHLHPRWQVEYARLITGLAKKGIPVLLTSHSPYVIQALKVFTEKEGISGNANYYLAENKEDGLSEITDVSNDLNRVFKKLSDPMQDLVWN